VVGCAVVGRDTLLLDAIAAVLQLRRGVRLLPWPSDTQAAPDGRGGPIGLIVLDIDGLEPRALHAVRTACEAAGDTRLMLITGTARGFRRPAWLASRRHVVVGRDESLEALLQKLDGLFAEWAGDGRAAGDGLSRHRPLTGREAEVASLLGEGLTTKEVATVLGLSPHTVQTHRKRIAEKLGRLGPPIVRRLIGQRQADSKGRPD
jgi:DNA-binding CsgD family transcriptional regulator